MFFSVEIQNLYEYLKFNFIIYFCVCLIRVVFIIIIILFQQWRLFPYVAATYAFKAFIQSFTDQFLECIDHSRNDDDNIRDMVIHFFSIF